jgi:putative endonuclease
MLSRRGFNSRHLHSTHLSLRSRLARGKPYKIKRLHYYMSSVPSVVEGLSMHFVYMIKNASNNLYTGITNNPGGRAHCHNTKQGANFTKNKNRFGIVFLEDYKTLKEARQREIQIKKWRRDKKEMLIEKYNLGQKTKIEK